MPTSTRTAPTVPDVLAAIEANRYTFSNERELQDGLAVALHAAGILTAREWTLGPTDRIDFVCGRVGVEVKIKGAWVSTGQQLQRYAASPDIDALVLVTTQPKHLRLGDTGSIGGKSLTVHLLGGLL